MPNARNANCPECRTQVRDLPYRFICAANFSQILEIPDPDLSIHYLPGYLPGTAVPGEYPLIRPRTMRMSIRE